MKLPTPDPREALERAGFREGCRDCDRAVARGWEACLEHYVPTRERAGEKTTGRTR